MPYLIMQIITSDSIHSASHLTFLAVLQDAESEAKDYATQCQLEKSH